VHHKRFHAIYKKNASESAQRSARVTAVHLETRAARALADEHRSVAESLKRSNEQLTRHANDLMQLTLQDPLTGLANRRLMERLLNDSPGSFSIVMIDVDRFKVINDGWSHVVGDAVLQQIALLIRGCCRESDTPVRYGGDEFSILLRNGDQASSMAIAERVRFHVESFDWGRIAERLKVSVSVGYSCAAEQDDAASALVIADRRLYEAKHAGRNCVVGGTPTQ
jgi:diguanylate cyclase (GGDEF)-like protein